MANSRSFPSGIRNYSSAINEDKAAPAFINLWDPSSTYTTPQGRAVTGSFRPAQPSDFVSTLNASGISLSINSISITGNPQVTVSNPILAVSGITQVSNFPANYAVTGGSISISNTPSVTIANGILPVSGSFAISGNLDITGTITTQITGSVLLPVSGTFSYNPSTTVSNSTVSGANGTALSANSNRKSWFIQNLATTGLYVKFGTSASDISFNMLLQGSSTPGGSASFSDDGARWRGAVSVSGLSNTTPNYIIWELT